MAYYGYQWRKYVPVAERRRKARRKMEQLRKQGKDIQPIEIDGRKIAKTFWGEAWCDHMESLGDFENRLPRGRTYVRNGSVCHLEIKKGRISAMVSGSSLYKIDIKIDTLPTARWKRVKRQCAGKIGSLIELLQGKLAAGVMEVVTDPDAGLFPAESEIHLDCNCPDWAHLCKHLAAVLYGIGARLDKQPELLFLLRGVKHDELIDSRVDKVVSGATGRGGRRRTVASDDLTDVFGIDIEEPPEVPEDARSATAKARRKKAPKKEAKTTSTPKSRKKKSARPTKKRTTTKKTTAKKKKLAQAGKKEPAKKVTKKKTSGSSTIAKRTVTKSAQQTAQSKAAGTSAKPAPPVKKTAKRRAAKKRPSGQRR